MIILKPDARVAKFAARFPATPSKDVPPGTTWDVYLSAEDGFWRCECPDHEFRVRACKHIEAAARAHAAAVAKARRS